MFSFETARVLNAFRCAAQIRELSDGKTEKDDGASDRAGSDDREKDRSEYVEQRVREIRRFERRANGDKS